VREIVVAELTAKLSSEKWPDFVYATVKPFPKKANGMICRGELAKLTLTGLSYSTHVRRS
jgi:hypothetical protein